MGALAPPGTRTPEEGLATLDERQLATTNREIYRLVYDLYDLAEEEINLTEKIWITHHPKKILEKALF